nr:hypothetical protein [Tanacetum cinerariifolium]
MVEGSESEDADEVDNFSSNSQNDPDTRLDLENYKGSLKELTVTDPTPSSSTPSSYSSKLSATQRLLSLFKPKTGRFKQYNSFFDELQGRYGYLFGHLKTRFLARKKFHVLAQRLQEVMEESLPKIVDEYVDSSVRNYMSGHILHVYPTQASQASAQEQQYQLYMTMKDNPQLQHDDLPICLALKIKFKGLHTFNTPCRSSAIRLRDQDDPHDANEIEQGPSTSEIVDENKLRKVINEMLRLQCTLGDEQQYHIDQMQNSLKNDIVWESRREILTLPFLQMPTIVVQSCQRHPKAPALSLVNQDLLYLKKGNLGSEKFVLSLHKFPAVIFPDDDIEERTSR